MPEKIHPPLLALPQERGRGRGKKVAGNNRTGRRNATRTLLSTKPTKTQSQHHTKQTNTLSSIQYHQHQTMMQSICSFGRVLSRGGGGSIGSLILLKQTCLPALQLVMANQMPTLTSNTTSRNVHINPYSGREDREGERDCQRKVAQHAQHGLKTEFMDYSTTIMQNAKMGLHESAEKRHRQRERNTEKKRGCSGKCGKACSKNH